MITRRNEIGTETTWWPEYGQSIYIVGPSGSGKSTLLYNLARKYIDEYRGVGVIDPHGDLVEELLECIPKNRVKDTVYFTPEMGLNLVEYNASPLQIEHTLEAFKSIWPMDTLTERLLRHTLILHSYVAESSLCDVLKTFPNNDEIKHEYTVETDTNGADSERIAELEAKRAVATLRFEEATKSTKTKESTLLSLQNTMQSIERKIAALQDKPPKQTTKEIKYLITG